MPAAESLLVVRRRTLTQTDWRAAGVLAGLRRATNEGIRAADRDRGQDKNILNDILGALTELLALHACEELPGVLVQHSLLDLSGPIRDATDLVLVRRRRMLLETKGHFLDQGKRYLAVNVRAHDRSRRRGAEGYVPVVSALGARGAVTGRVIPVGALDSWDVRRLGQHPDPARVLPIDAAVETYFDMRLVALEAEVLPVDPTMRQTALDAERAGVRALQRARRDQLVLPQLHDDITRLLNGLARQAE